MISKTLKVGFIAICAATVLLPSCKEAKPSEPIVSEPTEKHGLMLENIDTTVSPREDFYLYANGAYVKRTQIPAEESRWGVFSELREANTARLREIMEEASKSSAPKGSIEQQIGDYYHTAMDTAAIEALGVSAIQEDLDRIDAMQSKLDLAPLAASFHRRRISGLFSFWIDQDAKDSERYIPNLYQGGKGLPDRDYYLDRSSKREEIREKYRNFLASLLILSGEEEAAANERASLVLAMESEMAQNSMAIVEMRDPELTYHIQTLDDLKKSTPSFNWEAYFKSIGMPNPGEINVAQPKFFTGFESMLVDRSLDDWKLYLKTALLRSTCDDLSNEFVQANFDFYEKTLNGTEEMKVRWKRVVEGANWGLGFALGKKYTEKYFSANAKNIALEMVDNILEVMKTRLAELSWMSEETKAQAIQKVSTIMPKIGYPDKWRDYSKLEISSDSYIKNVFALNEFGFQFQMDKVGKPVDKTEWGMPPQIVNAYYNPSLNEIVFPAGILQAPFFDEHVDAALNYGGFGAVIGHELIHAFDDQGSRFDSEGNLRNWWTDADRKNFEERAAVVRQQYSEYEVLDSLFINGQLTLGENIADIHGLQMSYWAWERSLKGKPAPSDQDGYTPQQRFFVSFGQIWGTLARPEFLRLMVATNPHSPSEFRVIGALSNFPTFYEAFGVKEGDKMFREESKRSAIW